MWGRADQGQHELSRWCQGRYLPWSVRDQEGQAGRSSPRVKEVAQVPEQTRQQRKNIEEAAEEPAMYHGAWISALYEPFLEQEYSQLSATSCPT